MNLLCLHHAFTREWRSTPIPLEILNIYLHGTRCLAHGACAPGLDILTAPQLAPPVAMLGVDLTIIVAFIHYRTS